MRRRYVQIDGQLVEVSRDYVPEPRPGLIVMPDIEPFVSPITGETITGRRQKREHMRTHGVIEVGNEKMTPKPMRPIPREERRDAIRKAIADYKYGRRPRSQHG